jgi:hypothetical protein
MEALSDLVGVAVCLMVVRYGLSMAYESWTTGSTRIKNLIFSELWLLSLLPACFSVACHRIHVSIPSLGDGERARRIEATSVS